MHKKLQLTMIALIALTGCANHLGGNSGHLLSNGNQDTVIDDRVLPQTNLVGLSNGVVVERLGRPDLARYEDDVVYWRYSTEHCLVDIYLSADEESGELRVDYMKVRAKNYLAPEGACPIPANSPQRRVRDMEFRWP